MAGGFAVAVAVVLVFTAWVDTHGGQGGPVIVAAGALPAGTRLSRADLRTVTLRLGRGQAAATAFTTPEALIGRDLAVAVTPGELILRAEVPSGVPMPSLRPVPVVITPTDIVDLEVGDLVDVVETSGTAPDTTTAVVLRGARVLSTAQPANGLLGAGGEDVGTLGVTTLSEVTSTLAAEHAGSLDVVVGEPSDGTGSGSP